MDVEWRPLYETDKNAAFTEKYYKILKKVSKEADVFTVSTDYDVEGSTIGMNIIRFIMRPERREKNEVFHAYEARLG